MAVVDLQSLHAAYRGTGSRPFRPECLLAIALVEILGGVTSPAAWHRDASTRDQCKVVGNGVAPSRTAWYDFRDRCGKFIGDVHQCLITDAIDKELIDPHECSIDGTFTAAAASLFVALAASRSGAPLLVKVSNAFLMPKNRRWIVSKVNRAVDYVAK